MARCYECNGIIARNDTECFVCGEPVPGLKKKRSSAPKKDGSPAPAARPLANLLFVASLILTVAALLSGEIVSIALSVALSGILLLARVFPERFTFKRPLALGPVAVPSLDN
jgi:hypothetical protein